MPRQRGNLPSPRPQMFLKQNHKSPSSKEDQTKPKLLLCWGFSPYPSPSRAPHFTILYKRRNTAGAEWPLLRLYKLPEDS